MPWLAFRIETNLAIFHRKARVLDEAGLPVMWIEQRKRRMPDEVTIEGPMGPLVRAISRSIQKFDAQYELFAVDTGRPYGYLRHNGGLRSTGYDDIGIADDHAIVIDGRLVATLADDYIEITDATANVTAVLAIALMRACPELWFPETET